MISRLVVACFVFLLVALYEPIRADVGVDMQQAIQAIYDAQDVAIVNHDIDKTMLPYANDALFINDVDGKESASLAAVRQGWLSLFHAPNETLTGANHQIKEITFSKTHKEVTVLTLHRLNMSVTTRSGKAVPIEIDEQIRHYWVNSQNEWHIEQERIMSVDTLRDGKLVRHNHKPVTS